MTESSTIEAPTLSQNTLDRLAELRCQRRAITHEIKEILGSVIEDIVARPTVECLRCGFVWTPHSPAIRPRACARCVTTAWDKPPTTTSRKPSDPPSPSWRVRAGKRRARMQPEPKRIKYRRTPEQVKMDADEAARMATIAATASSNSALAPLLAPQMFVPPRISAILPPPPTPTSPSLSQWLRDVAVTAEESKPMVYDGVVMQDASEPQPERVSSHTAPPEPEPPSPVDNPVETVEILEEVPVPIVEEYKEESPLELESPLDVPPSDVGTPRTDAEREELARAKEEVWPTTRGDDD